MKKILALAVLSLSASAAMAEGMTWSGDLKFRHERYDQKASTTDYSKYNQERLAFRLGFLAAPVESVKVEARLATGSGGTSTNQTLGETNATATKNYDFKLDRANAAYEAYENLVLTAGRMGVKYYMVGGSDMLWDGDVNLDGLHAGYKLELGSMELMLNAGSFEIVQLKTIAAKESTLQAYQLALKASAGDTKLALTSALYNFVNLNQVTVGTAGTSNNTGTGVDFSVFNSGLEVKLPISIPVTLFADYAKNVAGKTASKGDAMMFGTKIGSQKEAGSWSVSYDYRKVEKYSTPSVYTDGDSFYSGTTDGKGHRVKTGYQLNNALALGVNYFNGKATISTTEKEFSKFQFDASVKF